MKTIKGCSRQNVQNSKTSVALLEAVKLGWPLQFQLQLAFQFLNAQSFKLAH